MHDGVASRLVPPLTKIMLGASALACESGRIGVHEVCAIRRDRDGRAGTPLVEGRAVMSR